MSTEVVLKNGGKINFRSVATNVILEAIKQISFHEEVGHIEFYVPHDDDQEELRGTVLRFKGYHEFYNWHEERLIL